MPPRAHLFGSRSKCRRSLTFVLPAVEAEGGLEQRHLAKVLLPAGLLSVELTGVLFLLRDCPGIREGHSLYVVERDPQKGGDAHDFVKWRSFDATELPPFDRAGTDADDLAESGAGVAGRLASLLQESGQGVLFERHVRTVLRSADLRISTAYSSDLLSPKGYRSLVVFPLIRW